MSWFGEGCGRVTMSERVAPEGWARVTKRPPVISACAPLLSEATRSSSSAGRLSACQRKVLRHGNSAVGQFEAAGLNQVSLLLVEKWTVWCALPTLPQACFPSDLVLKRSVPDRAT